MGCSERTLDCFMRLAVMMKRSFLSRKKKHNMHLLTRTRILSKVCLKIKVKHVDIPIYIYILCNFDPISVSFPLSGVVRGTRRLRYFHRRRGRSRQLRHSAGIYCVGRVFWGQPTHHCTSYLFIILISGKVN